MTSLAGARVLVTGAGGFVGPHLANALQLRGAEAHGAGLGPAPASGAFVSHRALDVTDAEACERVLRELSPTAIVHLAGQSSAARSFEDPDGTFLANLVGTWTLLEAVHAAAPEARVLVVGTSEVYGPIEPGTRAAESARFHPVSPYAHSKAAAELVAVASAKTYDLDVVRARPFGHTGPGQTPTFVIPSFAKQIAAIERGDVEPVLRVGNLDVTRDLSDVRDIVDGYCALLERGRAGEAYNLCRGEGVNLRDVVASLVAKSNARIRVEVDPARLRPADLPWLVGDPSKAEADTGWRAQRPLESTLVDVLEEWRPRV